MTRARLIDSATNRRPVSAAEAPATAVNAAPQASGVYASTGASLARPLRVEQLAPLVAREVEIEVLERAGSSHGQCEAPWQVARRAAVDQKAGSVQRRALNELRWLVVCLEVADVHLADLPAAAAAVHVVGNHVRPVAGMRFEPGASFGVRVDQELRHRL